MRFNWICAVSTHLSLPIVMFRSSSASFCFCVYISRAWSHCFNFSYQESSSANSFCWLYSFVVKGKWDNILGSERAIKNISYHDAHSCFRKIQLVVEAYQWFAQVRVRQWSEFQLCVMQCFCIGCAALGYPSQHLYVTNSNGRMLCGSCYLEV